jgi:hypothetical protein
MSTWRHFLITIRLFHTRATIDTNPTTHQTHTLYTTHTHTPHIPITPPPTHTHTLHTYHRQGHEHTHTKHQIQKTHAHIHTHTHNILSHIHTTDKHRNINHTTPYMHTYIHTYIHTYTHTHTPHYTTHTPMHTHTTPHYTTHTHTHTHTHTIHIPPPNTPHIHTTCRHILTSYNPPHPKQTPFSVTSLKSLHKWKQAAQDFDFFHLLACPPFCLWLAEQHQDMPACLSAWQFLLSQWALPSFEMFWKRLSRTLRTLTSIFTIIVGECQKGIYICVPL